MREVIAPPPTAVSVRSAAPVTFTAFAEVAVSAVTWFVTVPVVGSADSILTVSKFATSRVCRPFSLASVSIAASFTLTASSAVSVLPVIVILAPSASEESPTPPGAAGCAFAVVCLMVTDCPSRFEIVKTSAVVLLLLLSD